ncbi:AP endonuclease 2 [Apiospora hydei]|uniref:DNA-(apurinic or apyrimidinic site) endonuclease 2 n=1 Tax=Apiospora hydei TaxID=1337664 RepID=A0ABR1VI75_9PEZI
MGVRITSWNVNGIRNPFGYQPWRENRTFEVYEQHMFGILEADIVVIQEAKIQRKDLQDDMVLVPGWDVYFSLPKHKKGYSGVAIYTRNSVCAPIRAEEGITGVLCPPNSTTKFCELPEDQQIGGYPRPGQLTGVVDEATLDCEGRCVILEFPAFVLIGTYSPATRDESRDDFRLGYLEALDVRIRNLVAMGKRVILTGDLNVVRSGADTAGLAERLRKEDMTMQDFFSAPSHRLFNQLVFEGDVHGQRDEGREEPVLWDLGRLFHPTREGMYTCWEVKKNARPGNFGSRIDYVLCSDNMKSWAEDSNIQEGLMGSDHCPVFATFSDVVQVDGKDVHLRDLLNPKGMFQDGQRLREWTAKDLLPLSAKLIPEFDRRRSIKDMFFKKPTSTPKPSATPTSVEPSSQDTTVPEPAPSPIRERDTLQSSQPNASTSAASPAKRSASGLKRTPSAASTGSKPQKKAKTASGKEAAISKGQSSLMGFFKPKATSTTADQPAGAGSDSNANPNGMDGSTDAPSASATKAQTTTDGISQIDTDTVQSPASPAKFIDPIESKESWSKLLGKRVVPKCEHGEDCISLVTKKPGVNCGRSFYICPRPIGPSGQKEKNTEWRCGTFIWSSDWNGNSAAG